MRKLLILSLCLIVSCYQTQAVITESEFVDAGSGGRGGSGGAEADEYADAGVDANLDANLDVNLDASTAPDSGDAASAESQLPCSYEGEELDCYSGPLGTEDVGACHGGSHFCLGGVWGPCLGEVLPSPEVCDEIDNDCNGVVEKDGCL